MIAAHPPIHEPPERVSLTCALGLRFFDVATGLFVGADGTIGRESLGLNAVAWPIGAPHQKTVGVVTPSGIIAFHGLPGLREFENSGEADPWASPHRTRDFQVEVIDRMGRFLPCTFAVSAPEKGLALFAEDGSPPWIEAGAVPLFSAPSRTLPPGLAIVRMELRDLGTGREAAWAIVEVNYLSRGSRRTARGLADDKGRVLLLFAYPEGQRRAFNHSPPGNSPGLSQQEWTLEFAVSHEAVEHPEAAADYGRRLAQLPAIATRGGSPAEFLNEETLRFGQELNLGFIDLVPA
ncbi:MAG TPA: hypothetical protein VEX43_01895 [Chthoniobacterales bacterium]|nr:hypothetical protein [Chthoniobacterales bacterium]